MPGRRPVPFIQIHYHSWSREKLEIVSESFRAGLVLTIGRPVGGFCDLHISTREQIDIRVNQDGHTSVLRAPAWDANLGGIDEQLVRRFEAERQRHGGFLLLMQTGESMFLAIVEDASDRIVVGVIRPRPLAEPHAAL